MSNEPKQAGERIILTPEHSAPQVLAYLRAGQTDLEAARMHCMTVAMADDDETITAIERMGFERDIEREIMRAQRRLAIERVATVRATAKRVTFSPAGRAVLNGSVKINRSVVGKGGIMPSYYPAELSQFVDDLPLLLTAIVERANETVPASATIAKESDDQKEARAKSGAKFDRKSLTSTAHPRAGRSALDWANCEQAATVAKFRRIVDALKSVR